LTPEAIAIFSKKYDKYDKNHSNANDFNSFKQLYQEIETNMDKTKGEEDAQVIFDGIDVNDDKSISKEEFLDLVKTIKENDKLALYKIFFSGFDKNRSRLLKIADSNKIKRYNSFCNKTSIKKAQAEQIIQKK
jgi:Ca2+-binding EF-hand superfamily protein